MKENEIGNMVIDVTVLLHCELGPGLLETVFEDALMEDGITEGREHEHLCDLCGFARELIRTWRWSQVPP